MKEISECQFEAWDKRWPGAKSAEWKRRKEFMTMVASDAITAEVDVLQARCAALANDTGRMRTLITRLVGELKSASRFVDLNWVEHEMSVADLETGVSPDGLASAVSNTEHELAAHRDTGDTAH